MKLLLGHTQLESSARYLGIEVADALNTTRADRALAATVVVDKSWSIISALTDIA